MYVQLFWSPVCLWGPKLVGNYSSSGQNRDKTKPVSSSHSMGKCYKLKQSLFTRNFSMNSNFSWSNSRNTIKLCIKESIRPCSNAEQNPWTSLMEASDLLKMIEFFHNYKVSDFCLWWHETLAKLWLRWLFSDKAQCGVVLLESSVLLHTCQ